MGESVDRIAAGLDYPMVVVTACFEGRKAGCLVGFSTQCSIDPFRYLVMVSKANRTFEIASQSPALAVHFLSKDQLGLAKRFGEKTGDDVDKFTGLEWHEGPHHVPILANVERWLAGPITAVLPDVMGDHQGFVIEPTKAQGGPWAGQLGFQAVQNLDAGHDS